jgi:GntR family transcriptional regulator
MVDQIKYYIASETLKPGDQLPSIRELARKLAINPTTVVRVFSDLEHEGVIDLRHGKGVFVADAGPRLSAIERERALRALARQLAVEAVQMGAPPSQVIEVLREELADLRGADALEPPVKLSVISKR